MDLGIQGKWALVCAASKGLGKGCAVALAREGVHVVVTARGAEALEATAAELRAISAGGAGGEVRAVAGDITTDAGRAAALAACPAGGHPGQQRRRAAARRLPRLGPRRVDRRPRRQHAGPDRADEGDGRCDGRPRLRSRGQHHLGRRQGAHRDARPLERRPHGAHRLRRRPLAERPARCRGVTINGLLPGAFDTDRLRGTNRAAAQKRGVDEATISQERLVAIPSKRFGDAAEFGAVCAFLCSVHAGYITGQNVLIDGGAFAGTL
jgi:3-oxoacyl-[acyl-carrier protein] reductase